MADLKSFLGDLKMNNSPAAIAGRDIKKKAKNIIIYLKGCKELIQGI